MTCMLVIDQGTTSTRAILYQSDWSVLTSHQIEFKQYFPNSGWVEHDPEEIWESVQECCMQVLSKSNGRKVLGLGISNQRETTVLWDRKTGKSLSRAIVWQDRRTLELCSAMKSEEPTIYAKTGLILDPYFSATKIDWLLANVPGLRERAERDEVLFGTIDCFLLWHLTRGKVHATDITNAARTMLYNINELTWDDELLTLFKIPRQMLPEVKPNITEFGCVEPTIFGLEIPILAMMGDQQAALVGQGCLAPGDAKCTYGTGCFLMVNTGENRIISKQKLLNTIAFQIKGETRYALEGSVFSAGVIIKWLRDQLHLIEKASDSETYARELSGNGGVYLVPAFTGLGAPYWDPAVRGAIFGLNRDTGPKHIVRAGLESIAYQTQDLLMTFKDVQSFHLGSLKVDGGMTANAWLMQFLADILQLPIEVNANPEATSLGIAYLLGLSLGIIDEPQKLKTLSKQDRVFVPEMPPTKVHTLYEGWLMAVNNIVH